MAMLARLTGRQALLCREITTPTLLGRVSLTSTAVRKTGSDQVRLKARQEMKAAWVKNETRHRPISPHLMIYKMELPMTLSLFHRATGVATIGSLYIFSWATLALPGNFESYVNMVKDLHIENYAVGPAFLFVAKALFAWPLMYHSVNGLRHLAWDTGKGFNIKTLYKTGYFAFAVSIGLSVLVASLAYQ